MSVTVLSLSILTIIAITLIVLVFCCCYVAINLNDIRGNLQSQQGTIMQEIENLKNYQAGVYNALPQRDLDNQALYSFLERETEIKETYSDIQLGPGVQEEDNKCHNDDEDIKRMEKL